MTEHQVDIVVVFAAVFMLLRQMTMVGTLGGTIAAHGSCKIKLGFWVHLAVTCVLVTAVLVRSGLVA